MKTIDKISMKGIQSSMGAGGVFGLPPSPGKKGKSSSPFAIIGVDDITNMQ